MQYDWARGYLFCHNMAKEQIRVLKTETQLCTCIWGQNPLFIIKVLNQYFPLCRLSLVISHNLSSKYNWQMTSVSSFCYMTWFANKSVFLFSFSSSFIQYILSPPLLFPDSTSCLWGRDILLPWYTALLFYFIETAGFPRISTAIIRCHKWKNQKQ